MNEELLSAAIFEQAITDYKKANRYLSTVHFGNKKQLERDREKAKYRISDVRSFATGSDAIMYAGGSKMVIKAFVARLDEIDREYSVLRG